MVIDRRKAVRQQIGTLNEKIALEQEYLLKLSSAGIPAAPVEALPSDAKPPSAL